MRNRPQGDSVGRRFRIPLFFSLAGALPALLSACSGRDEAAQGNAPAERPRVRLATVAQIKQAVERHKGRVVLLDIWATWCGPCRAQFPNLSKWLDKYGAEKIAVVALSIDEPDDLQSKVIPFLASQQTDKIDLLLYSEGDHDRLVNSIDPEWAGEVPALFIYDRAGKLRFSLTGEHEPQEVDKSIEKLLEQAGP